MSEKIIPKVTEQVNKRGGAWADIQEKRMFERLAELPEGSPGKQRLRQELVDRHRRLVLALARRFVRRGEPMEDLIQAGYLGLIKAVNRFDVARGNTFVAYAAPMILGEIRHQFRDAGWMVRVPRHMQDLKISVMAAIDDLTARHGRRPSCLEVARELGIRVDDVEAGLKAESLRRVASLDLIVGDGNDHADTAAIGREDEALESVIDHESLWPLLAELSDPERTVLLMRFYGNETQSEVAEELGMTQGKVSGIERKACALLRHRLLAA
jgi:RNA polymerase sigma-B factor